MYPRKLKQEIHGFLRKAGKRAASEYDFVLALNRIGASFSKHYQFDMAHPNKYIATYKMEHMFPRADLGKLKRYTRRAKRGSTTVTATTTTPATKASNAKT
jgi:hypothetical protein